MLRKILIIISFAFSFTSVSSQVVISKKLADSIIKQLIDKSDSSFLSDLDVIKFTQYPELRRKLFLTQTFVSNRNDIPDNSYLYLNNGYNVLIVFNNSIIFSDLQNLLIKKSDSRFTQILDSLKIRKEAMSGVVPLRLSMDFITIKKRCLSGNSYKLTFEKIFPASSAPKELWPVDSFTDGQYMVDPPYKFLYDNKGEMLEKYKKQLIPRKPLKIKLKK